MLKKIILAVLLVGFTGVLVWGGVNRTLAKTGSSEGSNGQGEGQYQSQDGNRGKQRDTHEEAGLQADTHDNVSVQAGNRNSFALDSSQSELANPQGNQGNGGGRGGNGGRGQGQGGSQGNQSLDETEIQALQMAIDDEYHALAVYQSVIDTFGEVEPFVEIAQSEQHHIEALIKHFDKYGLPVPENTWIGKIPPFESVQAACQAGAEAEIANAALYDQLFSMTGDPGLIQVFTNLSRASLESHLPQFEACRR
jgi:hypothetical protein